MDYPFACTNMETATRLSSLDEQLAPLLAAAEDHLAAVEAQSDASGRAATTAESLLEGFIGRTRAMRSAGEEAAVQSSALQERGRSCRGKGGGNFEGKVCARGTARAGVDRLPGAIYGCGEHAGASALRRGCAARAARPGERA